MNAAAMPWGAHGCSNHALRARAGPGWRKGLGGAPCRGAAGWAREDCRRRPAPARAGSHIVGGMGKILLLLLGVFAVIMLVSLVISALHFLFVVALIAVILVGAMRLTGGLRRRRARS